MNPRTSSPAGALIEQDGKRRGLASGAGSWEVQPFRPGWALREHDPRLFRQFNRRRGDASMGNGGNQPRHWDNAVGDENCRASADFAKEGAEVVLRIRHGDTPHIASLATFVWLCKPYGSI